MDILTLHPRGSFSLLESRRFLEGFAPAGREATLATGPMRLAFPVEGDWRTAGVALTQSAEGAVRAELTGPPPPRAGRPTRTRDLRGRRRHGLRRRPEPRPGAACGRRPPPGVAPDRFLLPVRGGVLGSDRATAAH